MYNPGDYTLWGLIVKLNDIARGIGQYELVGDGSVWINDVTYDSRDVQKGDLFCAIRGEKVDGNQYVEAAIKAGASAILTSRSDLDVNVPVVVVPYDRSAMTRATIALYKKYLRKVRLWGVTGTNGKTTSTVILQSILNSSGCRTGTIGTLGWSFGDKSGTLERTTPEAPDLVRLIRNMVEHRATDVVMEVTSVAVIMRRIERLRFHAAWFTNLSQDHLDVHNTMEEYFEAKHKFFRYLGRWSIAASNLDSPYGSKMLEGVHTKTLTYAFNQPADIRGVRVGDSKKRNRIQVKSEYGRLDFISPLVGLFNDENVLGCCAVAMASGMDFEAIQKGVERVPQIRGRMECLELENGVRAVVDYSHTPAALEEALSALRPSTERKLVVVFGAGGDRDRSKRPIMGQIASQWADRVYVTSDNPRTEEPEKIVQDILEGTRGSHVESIVDRREAIRTALNNAWKGDTVLVAGKGHETYQEINGVKHDFDDREEILQISPEIREEFE